MEQGSERNRQRSKLTMADSTHRAEVVPVVLEKHPNADALSIVKIYDGGYQVIVRTADWPPEITKGVYVQPDSLVPLAQPEFAFLADPQKPGAVFARIKARKLRGQWSMGLLIACPPAYAIGEDLAPLFEIKHYDPPEPGSGVTGGNSAPGPKYLKTPNAKGKHDSEPLGFEYPKYDVDSFRKYWKVFEQDEPLFITEKIHGANARFVYDGKDYHCATRTRYLYEDANNSWWKALNACPELKDWLAQHPGVMAYAEIYGQVQDLKYGTAQGVPPRIATFDLLREGQWLGPEEARSLAPNIPWVPQLLNPDNCSEYFTFDFEKILALADGPTLVETIPWVGPKHVREGIVISPLEERWHPKCGRVKLKIVSAEYLARSK